MAESYSSALVQAPVDRVWRVFGDFAALADWHPAIIAGELEQDSSPFAVGAVRELRLADGSTVRERLIAFDSLRRSYGYEMLEGPFQVRNYRAMVRVAPVTTTGATFAEWWASYDPAPEPDTDRAAELDRVFREDVFATGLAALGRVCAE
ncbi:Polyketide cyclase / dehydrase and lipid transport [Actinopolyspora mzabensis]|uniref:Polyketide cyclase / dehydrase and lipid transport n=1 Tax=Actinopolyspora mzabensis TaxID=995066 RepID=A0A1G8Z264_ACTMZ|nr:SRPBCC family protein [Actinopolyspora mzabensis]SDK09093.1 Polyketide cyclase / dehydrase and lipid transport [Actinopolyspora mzabensis]